uniref:SRCR domain-containing protein n=1 Tax=Caenorhabditis tropicalis TaxID=1561998 RepID=A0A1I7UI11_9PELO
MGRIPKNQYHPSMEIFSCRDPFVYRNLIDITGNRIDGNLGYGMRISPAVNMHTVISSNQFLHNNDTALYIRNAQWPELSGLPAEVTISKNVFKFNVAKYIISIGMNEDAPKQSLLFNQQNEIRANTVFDPFPSLPPRSTPYAALVVSSSNVRIHRNCFNNERARYEIATELERHAKWIDARENNWGFQEIPRFIDKFFDQFNRYSLASIDIDPYMAACNQRMPYISLLNGAFRQFKKTSEPNRLGGIIYENHDLLKGRYTVTEDLQVVPGAKLTIASGSILEFQHGIGMLVQGDLIRNEYDQDEKVIFTSTPFILEKRANIRLVDADGNDEVTEGRLEVLVDEQWGTVCNRSWTPQLTVLACNQLGLVADVQYFENWRVFPEQGDLPMVMDNIRCEENEVDITRCRHDGIERNCAAGCRKTEVVGLRCLEPRWAGVRYSLLANPPTVTGQTTMDNWRIEKGGLFNFRTSEFCAAFKIDWNYHTFHRLEIRNNFWDGVDVVYNDLVKKPAIRNSIIYNNRRNGFHVRSAGITVENVTISFSGQSGVRYNPSVSALEQEDIVSWLSLKEQPELEANNIFRIPDQRLDLIEVMESNLNQRKFLVAAETEDCPDDPLQECVYNLMIRSVGYQYGLASKMAIQIVNPPSNTSDEDAIFTEVSTGKSWSARKDQIYFPVVSTENAMRMRYTRSYGTPKLVILVLFLDRPVVLISKIVESRQRHSNVVTFTQFSDDFQQGNEFAHIEMLPYQQQINYDDEMPKFRLVDGPTVRQGRLQVQFRDRWRSVCTMVTNWTSIDTGTACRSMGYSDGGFWKWYLRNNDTYPFVMPKPDCHGSAKNLWDCPAFSNPNNIRLSENLCQGEDDIGIYCWGPPTFTGWARHWKGIQILNSPFHYVNSDPDLVAVNRESNSRLEFVDILYAGYDGVNKNTTSALYIEGVPPIMNGLRIEHSARDGLQLLDTNGPAIIANSTFSFNRGHGIFVVNTTDARIFVNNTRIQGNWGDGIWYKQRTGVNLIDYGMREKRGIGGGRLEEEKPRIDMCSMHRVDDNHFFPHLISVNLKNRTFLDPTQPPICWMVGFFGFFGGGNDIDGWIVN